MWNAECHVAPLVTTVTLSDDKNTRLAFKKLAHLVGAQIPHFRDFPNGIVPLDVHRGFNLRCCWHGLKFGLLTVCDPQEVQLRCA